MGYKKILVFCFVRCILHFQHLNGTNKYCFSQTMQLSDCIDEGFLLFLRHILKRKMLYFIGGT